MIEIRKITFLKDGLLNNLGLEQGMTLKLYTSLEKGLKPKVKKSLGLIPTFVEVTGESCLGFFLPINE